MIIKDLENETQYNFSRTDSIIDFNLTQEYFNESVTNFSLIFEKPRTLCCLFNKCYDCCIDSCSGDKDKYPVIFLHGHDFNEKVSAESSLNSFQDLQTILENEGYINAGSLIARKSKDVYGILGRTDYPVSIRASYYFDIYENNGEQLIIQTKADSLDSYTLRLKDIIEDVKYKTGKDKVVIISHSMGGLVARKYAAVFGTGSIHKIILIGTPNHGISGSTLNYCPILGTKLECKDMDEKSLFISKLNSQPELDIPIYNIIGIGCNTNGEDGDGIVRNSSAYLQSGKNYYVKGSCDGMFNYMHVDFINPEKYPETYKIIRDALKE